MKALSVALISIVMMVASWAATAQTVSGTPGAAVRFISQSGEVLQHFDLDDTDAAGRIREALSAGDSQLISVSIRSGASPEGNSDTNRALSDKRAEDTRSYLLSAVPELAQVPVTLYSVGEDYETLLVLLDQSDIPGARRAAEIIRTVPIWVTDASGAVIDSRKKQLMDLRGGETWNRMCEEIFPDLRRVWVNFQFAAADTLRTDNTGASASITTTDPVTGIRTRHVILPGLETYFPVSVTTIRPNYLTNAATLAQIDRTLKSIQRAPERQLSAIRLYSGASPEGSITGNFRLSDQRALAVKRYILGLDPTLAPDLFDIHSPGEDYDGLALRLLGSDHPWAANALDIIHTTNPWEYDGHTYYSDRKTHLRTLEHGQAWRLMLKNDYPYLRHTRVVFEYNTDLLPVLSAPAAAIEQAQTGSLAHRRLSDASAGQRMIGKRSKTILALKTNLLYDAATMLNYGVEFPLGKRFSVVWEHYLPWWVMRNNRTCIQYLTLGGEARWWFLPQPRAASARRVERDRLVGHFLGVYGFWGKTDLQWDRIGCYQCDNVWSAGLTYGFAFPLTRHLNLELDASFGVARIPYQHYIPSDDWQILWRDYDNVGITYYFGPTKIQVSLVMPIRVTYQSVREGARR